MTVQTRPISADELETFQRVMSIPFSFDLDDESSQRFARIFEVSRLRAAYDGDDMVATFGALSFQLAVPGGVVPAAGTTVVTVLPTHRRQGIFRDMMTQHLDEVHAAGEPLAVLWASESSIYGRFGYGPATEKAVLKIPKSHAVFAAPVEISGTMRLVSRDEAAATFPSIYNVAATSHPGMFQRSESWWQHRTLVDPQATRGSATSHRRVLYTRDGQPAGYIIYRTHRERDDVDVKIVELVGVDAACEKALWQFLFDIDLAANLEYWNQPVDSPLDWWLVEPRRMERIVSDALWVRLVDVPAALQSRRYSREGSLVLRVCDDRCPWNDGVYRLDVDAGGTGSCVRTERNPQLELTPYALGALYLGGKRCCQLSRAGVISGSPAAITLADQMFAWDRSPWCQEIF